jgi:type IV secretory pathway protease TraF
MEPMELAESIHGRLRSAALAFGCGVLVAIPCDAQGSLTPKPPQLLLNTTASLPLGFYARVDARARVGGLAAFRLPSSAAFRGVIPPGTLLLKPVAAVGGAHVCGRNRRLYVEGRAIATALAHDRHGGLLRQWNGCRSLAENELLMISTYSERSFDSRYFGPIQTAQIVASYVPALTFQVVNP